MTDAMHADVPAGQSLQLALSNEMVKLYKELFGRGPTKARTNFAGPDLIICSLENTLTPAERSMVDMGEHQRLRDMRLFFQHAREKDFCEAVERITGRTVRGFVSGMDTHQDISAEIFYLVPQQDGDGAGA
jgi:uncharacterized protein YbcI